MAELRCKTQENLKDYAEPFDRSNNYQKAIRFGDAQLKATLTGYIEHINTRNENARLEEAYNAALKLLETATTEDACYVAADKFKIISGYKDADKLVLQCTEKAETIHKELLYKEAESNISIGKSMGIISKFESAIDILSQIEDYKDASDLIAQCKVLIEEETKKQEAAAKRNQKIAVIAIPTLCAMLIFFILAKTVIIPNKKYNDAIALMEAGSVVEAYERFAALGDYKDSAEKANSIFNEYMHEKLYTTEVGDYLFFGSYEQDNNLSNGKEDIEWLVLEVKNDKVLVISKYALDRKPYNEVYQSVTWEDSSLRRWLNSYFLSVAFSAEEKAMIPIVTVSADKNPKYDTNPGKTTQDQVFLLSITEANRYFSSDSARQCESTAYAVANGAFNDNGNCWWWLRSPGVNQSVATRITEYGTVDKGGTVVTAPGYSVRPAMWIDLNA